MKRLNVCLISKYPPHKGGTSSGIYWYARTLGSLGIKVHVVTDTAQGESAFRSSPEYEPKNVTVHAVNKGESLESTASSLTDKIIEVVKDFEIDILDSKYLIPYGMAAKKAKEKTGLPLVIKHGGSDLQRLNKKKDKTLLDVLRSADLISTSPSRESFFIKRGIEKDKLTFESGFGVNHDFFGPHVKPFDIPVLLDYKRPVIGLFGKILHKKGLEETIRALSCIDEDFTLLLIPESHKEIVKTRVKRNGIQEKTIVMDYQPPWVMPSLYAFSIIVVAMDIGMKIKTHIPLTGIEALNAGTCVVTNKETFGKPFFNQFEDNASIVVVDPGDTGCYGKRLSSLIKNPDKAKSIGLAAKELCKKHDGRILAENMIKLYDKLVNK